MKVFWSLNLVPTHWAPIFIRMCHNTPVCWFDWPLVPMLKGVTVQHFLTILFKEPQIRSKPPVSLVISHILWDAENSPNITKGNWQFAWWRTWVQSLGHTHFFQKDWARQSRQSQQSHSMMAQAVKSPNVSENKHILIILIVLYNSHGNIGKIDGYLYIYIWYMIYDLWYMIFDIWYMIWYIDGRKFDPNWASAAILSDRGWNLAFGRRELFNVSRHGSAFPRSGTFWNLPSSTVEKCVRMCWCWCILFELSEIPKHRKNNQKQQCAFLSLQSLEMLAHSRTRFLHCCDATQSVLNPVLR